MHRDQFVIGGWLLDAAVEIQVPRAPAQVCLFVWAMCLNALLALVALDLNPLSPKFVGASAVAALLRAYPNFCFNVRDAKTDAGYLGSRRSRFLLGEEGIRRAYRWSVCVVLPGCAAVLAWVAQTVSDDRLTGGAPVLVSIGLVPHGVAAARAGRGHGPSTTTRAWTGVML